MFISASPVLLASIAIAMVLGGCDPGFGLDEPLFDCDDRFLPGECVDSDDPLAFTTDIGGLAPGAETALGVLVHDSLAGFRVRSSDPDVLEVDLDSDRNVVAHARGIGEARIEAVEREGDRILDTLSLVVAEVARTEFFYYPGGDAPVAELAGVAGTNDVIYVVHYSSDGVRLAVDGTVEYEVDGPLAVGGEVEIRESDFLRAVGGELTGSPLVLRFIEPGLGQFIARTGEGDEFSLPVRGVVAADRHDIEPADELEVGARTLLLLRSATADGVTVTGARGTWSLEETRLATISMQGDRASEAAIEPIAAGTITVRVDVDGVAATESLRIREPRRRASASASRNERAVTNEP